MTSQETEMASIWGLPPAISSRLAEVPPAPEPPRGSTAPSSTSPAYLIPRPTLDRGRDKEAGGVKHHPQPLSKFRWEKSHPGRAGRASSGSAGVRERACVG